MKKKLLLGCILLVLGLTAKSVYVDAKENITTWDCIWLGNYPQTEVRDTAGFTNKQYIKNSEGRICGYTVKNKDGERITIGTVVSSDERQLFGRTDSWTGADRNFKYEPVKWRILKTDGKKALLLSDKIIDQYYMYTPTFADGWIYYTGLQMDFIWRNASLRQYMNNVMYNMAFSKDEQRAILDSNVTSGFTYKDEKDVTQDKLFLLSYDELVKNYGFKTQQSFVCRISDFGRASGTNQYDSYGKNGTYFVLSDGYKSTLEQGVNSNQYAFCEAYNDAIDSTGALKQKNALYYNGIRAAMWVDLSKCKYQKAGTVTSNGEVREIKFKCPVKLTKIKLKYAKMLRRRPLA